MCIRDSAPGAKLHTARSRNDQVATDTRLYCRAEIAEILGKVRHLQRALVMKAKEYACLLYTSDAGHGEEITWLKEHYRN